MSKLHWTVAFLKYNDCVEFYTSRTLFCDRDRNIEMSPFDPRNRDFKGSTKSKKKAPGAYSTARIFDKRFIDVEFKVFAKDKFKKLESMDFIFKHLSPPKTVWGDDFWFRPLDFCTIDGKEWKWEAQIQSLRKLEEDECTVSWSVRFLMWSNNCVDPGCFTGDFMLRNDNPTEYPVNNLYPVDYPTRIENLVGQFKTEICITNCGNPFFADTRFQNAIPVMYEGKSCCPLSFRIDFGPENPGPLTIYVFDSEGVAQVFHIDGITPFPAWSYISLDSRDWELTLIDTSWGTVEVTEIYPLVSNQYSAFPCLCPKKPFKCTFGDYDLTNYNHLVIVDVPNPESVFFSMICDDKRC